MESRKFQSVNRSAYPLKRSPKKSCVPYIDNSGKKWYIKIEMPSNLQNSSNMYGSIYTENNFLVDAPDGIYTWILSDSPDGLLTAIKVRSVFELGTVHNALAERSGATKVYAAGELRKKDSNLEINVMSGTFSLKILENSEMNESELKSWAAQQFRNFGFKVTELPIKSLLTIKELPVMTEELELYHSIGYIIKMYSSLAECQDNKEQLFQYQINLINAQIETINNSIKIFEQKIVSNPKKADLFKKYISQEISNLKLQEEKLEKVKAEYESYKLNPNYILFKQEGGLRSGKTRRNRKSFRNRKIKKTRNKY